jgi:hypothetical protein
VRARGEAETESEAKAEPEPGSVSLESQVRSTINVYLFVLELTEAPYKLLV